MQSFRCPECVSGKIKEYFRYKSKSGDSLYSSV